MALNYRAQFAKAQLITSALKSDKVQTSFSKKTVHYRIQPPVNIFKVVLKHKRKTKLSFHLKMYGECRL